MRTEEGSKEDASS